MREEDIMKGLRDILSKIDIMKREMDDIRGGYYEGLERYHAEAVG